MIPTDKWKVFLDVTVLEFPASLGGLQDLATWIGIGTPVLSKASSRIQKKHLLQVGVDGFKRRIRLNVN
jgi:hypothetical protein